MRWFFSTLILRQLLRHPGLAILNITGVALGVAVFLSIQIANESSLRAFRNTLDVVAGKSQLEIIGTLGRFDEKAMETVMATEGVSAATATIEEVCAVMESPESNKPPQPSTYLRILGIDIFSNQAFRPFDFKDGKPGSAGFEISSLETLLKNHRSISITQSMADKRGLKAGDTINILVNQETIPLLIASTFTPDEGAIGADEHLAIMDIAAAQELFNAVGLLNRIDIRTDEWLTEGKLRERLDSIKTQITPFLPKNIIIQAPDRRGNKVEKMLWAFQLNLTALSLLSLVVGMFLIYNSMTTSVVRRRKEIGILRACGMSSSDVQTLFLAEAAILGFIGIILGWALGLGIAHSLTGAVAQTIRSLYLTVSIETLTIPFWLYPGVFIIGMGAVLLSAYGPAREAAQIAPTESFATGNLHQRSLLNARRSFEIGLAICIISGLSALGALYFYPPLGFFSALSLILGVAFFCPLILKTGCGLISGFCLGKGWLLPGLAARQIAQALNRTSVAVAALMAALSMMVGVSIMIHSFRSTVDAWIAQTVKADILVSSSAQLLIGPRASLSPAMIDTLRKHPDIRLVDTYAEKKITYAGQTIKAAAIPLRQVPAQNNLRLLDTTAEAMVEQIARGDGVLISDVFARKFKVTRGDILIVDTPSGKKKLKIISRYRDYTTELGIILMDESLMKKLWGDYLPQNMGLYLKDPAKLEPIRAMLIGQFAPQGELMVYSNGELKTKILDIFDQTFAITYVLRTIALVIAGLGIFQTLTVLVSERTRELGILRSIGVSQTQMKRLIITEAALLGFASGATGLIAGVILSFILCYVINLAFFRWTIEWALPVGLLFWTIPSVIMISALAALIPARRAAKLKIVECIQSE